MKCFLISCISSGWICVELLLSSWWNCWCVQIFNTHWSAEEFKGCLTLLKILVDSSAFISSDTDGDSSYCLFVEVISSFSLVTDDFKRLRGCESWRCSLVVKMFPDVTWMDPVVESSNETMDGGDISAASAVCKLMRKWSYFSLDLLPK